MKKTIVKGLFHGEHFGSIFGFRDYKDILLEKIIPE